VYLRLLAEVSDADECALIGAVLADPDQVMAEATVIQHIHRKAAALAEDGQYEDWCQRIAPILEGHPEPERHLRDWSLWVAISSDSDWSTADLAAARSWLQRKVADEASSLRALAFLAEQGRGRAIRNVARSRLRR
jgi:hypothetical protein